MNHFSKKIVIPLLFKRSFSLRKCCSEATQSEKGLTLSVGGASMRNFDSLPGNLLPIEEMKVKVD